MTTTIETCRRGLRSIRDGLAGALHPAKEEREGGALPLRPARRTDPAPRLAIRDVMQGDLATVGPESPLLVALELMIASRISSVPVVDGEGRIVGALNEKDLMKVFYEIEALRVGDVMTRDPVSFALDAPLVDVIDELMASNFRRVLIHAEGRLVGVITRSHLMPALLEVLERRLAERPAPH